MLADYVRAAAGLLPTTAIPAILPVGIAAATILGCFAALFAVFGIRTMFRHGTRYEMTESTLRASGLRHTSIAWRELDRMNLAFYSTRRDHRDGWMQLELRSNRSSIRLDSRIQGFAELVERSARAAQARGLSLSAATSANLAALGIRLHVEPAVPETTGDPV